MLSAFATFNTRAPARCYIAPFCITITSSPLIDRSISRVCARKCQFQEFSNTLARDKIVAQEQLEKIKKSPKKKVAKPSIKKKVDRIVTVVAGEGS